MSSRDWRRSRATHRFGLVKDYRNSRRAPQHRSSWACRIAAVSGIGFLVGCVASPVSDSGLPPGTDFCTASDLALRPYLVSVDVPSWTSASGVAVIVNGQTVVLTNRHNLPPNPDLAQIALKNHKRWRTGVTAVAAAGRDYGLEGGLGPARDFVILRIADPTLFKALPLSDRRYSGPVAILHRADRLYGVARAHQRGYGEFDRLDVALNFGASGAPILTCDGTVVGLYTARIPDADIARAGFAGIGTPATVIRERAIGR